MLSPIIKRAKQGMQTLKTNAPEPHGPARQGLTSQRDYGAAT
jgi:hypothetical protein